MTHLSRAQTLSSIGVILAFIGGALLITIAILHFFNIWTPWYGFIRGGFGYANIVFPLLTGLVGVGFTLFARRQVRTIPNRPKWAGIDLIISGILAGICTFGIGGLLIFIGGIFSLLHYSDVGDAAAEPKHVCPKCKAANPPDAKYCHACGAHMN